MKWWTISVLLLFMICLTVPFVTADKPVVTGIGNDKPKKTLAKVEITPKDSIAPLKKLVGVQVDARTDVKINGRLAATIPEDSPLLSVDITEECLKLHPYGSVYWYQCEGGT